MYNLEIDEEMARTILQMGSDCFVEGLLREDGMDLLLEIREEFPDTAEEYGYIFHRVEK